MARALVVAAVAASVAAAAPRQETLRIAFLRHGNLVVRDLATQTDHVVLRNASPPIAWSGDAQLLSAGSQIVGGPLLPSRPVWAPEGEKAAYATTKGGVAVWTPGERRIVAPDGWGATTLAWSDDGRLAIGRSVCHATCGLPTHRGTWVWNGTQLSARFRLPSGRHAANPFTARGGVPMPVAWTADGRVVWWSWPNSGSLAADGVGIYADRTRLGTTLMYSDYVTRCGPRLAIVAGIDRYATHGKRIVLDGRDVSRDRSRSWVSPACSTDGSVLVAAAGRNWVETRFGREHRAIWQLLPTRRQLTRPPQGWTDECPKVLPDGSTLFVRTRETSRKRYREWYVTFQARIERLGKGRPTFVSDIGFSGSEFDVLGDGNYYGHYGWASRFAVAP